MEWVAMEPYVYGAALTTVLLVAGIVAGVIWAAVVYVR